MTSPPAKRLRGRATPPPARTLTLPEDVNSIAGKMWTWYAQVQRHTPLRTSHMGPNNILRKYRGIWKEVTSAKTYEQVQRVKSKLEMLYNCWSEFIYSLEAARSDLSSWCPPLTTQDSLAEELLSVKNQFEGFQALTLSRDHGFSVYTPPITLHCEETDTTRNMGRFVLRVVRSSEDVVRVNVDSYTGTTLSSDGFFHPHVDEEGKICMGDAANAIKSAAREGRLLDMLDAVMGVLTTYNIESPYSRLDEWNMGKCYDCGSRAEDITECVDCHRNYCDVHIHNCACGSCFTCGNCYSRCDYCTEYYSPSCESAPQPRRHPIITARLGFMCSSCWEDRLNEIEKEEQEESQEESSREEEEVSTVPPNPTSTTGGATSEPISF